jgi:hypothetical protein
LGTNGINRASPGTAVEKRAVAVLEFPQTDATANQPRMFDGGFSDRFADVLGDRGYFFAAHPHNAGRAGAAVAALSAGESQAVLVPGFVAHTSILGNVASAVKHRRNEVVQQFGFKTPGLLRKTRVSLRRMSH